MRIVGFFSFKGGVGRTALMVSMGARLAALGRRVLLIDFDLSAPGLTMLPDLGDWIREDWRDRGVGDCLRSFFATMDRDGPYDFVPPSHVIRRFKPGDGKPGEGRLYAIDAGASELDRPIIPGDAVPFDVAPRIADGKVSKFEWSLRSLAADWRADLEAWRDPEDGRGLDAVFIDCRTGYPELIDLSLGFLADHMVVLSGLNRQNLAGLRITLDALTGRRVTRLADEVTVVLSPVPADPDESTTAALSDARAIVHAARKTVDGRREPAPAILRLPYWSRLAVADPPFLPKDDDSRTPYHRAVDEVTDRLFPRGGVEAAAARAAAEVAEVLDGARPVQTIEIGSIGAKVAFGVPSVRGGSAPRPGLFHGMPRWFWPLEAMGRNEDEIAAFLTEKTGGTRVEGIDWGEFLDDLAASSMPRLSKEVVLSSLPTLSVERARGLLKTFADGTRRLSSLTGIQGEEAARALARSFSDWGETLGGGSDAWRRRLLVDPIEGRSLAPGLESRPAFWVWTAEELVARLNDHPHALAATTRARELDGLSVWDWVRLGNLLQDHLGRYEEAEEAYRRAIELDAKYALPWNNLGNLLQDHLGRFEEAEAVYRRAIELDAKSAWPWNGLGNLLKNHLGRFEEAEAAYRRAIELDAKYALPWNNLGYLYQRLGAPERALEAFDRAGALSGKAVPYALMNRGRTARRVGVEDSASPRAALAGFADDDFALDARMFLAVALDDRPAVSAAAERAEAAIARGRDDLAPRLALVFRDCVAGGTGVADAVPFVRSREDQYDAVWDFYDLAGFRPDAREAARTAARMFRDLPAETAAGLRGVPKPDYFWDRLVPFLEGRSDGAGDPRDFPLWRRGPMGETPV